ncbi:uncharacterized protein [Chironomus tepperi]|uniref:uncharacterized protein n=1 Tax=Chironomus tepperi TaxID=113505 RepID=UPI00391F8DDC
MFLVPPKSLSYQNIWIDLDESFLGSICLPNSCSSVDVKNILELAFGDQNLTFKDVIYCRKEFNRQSDDVIERLELPMLNWLNLPRILIFIGITSVTLIFSIIGPEKLKLTSIIKDLFNFSSNASSTAYLNGFKAIATILIILYHCLISRLIFPFKNGENLQELLTGAFYQSIQVIVSLMEIFFIIGGILAVKTFTSRDSLV